MNRSYSLSVLFAAVALFALGLSFGCASQEQAESTPGPGTGPAPNSNVINPGAKTTQNDMMPGKGKRPTHP